MRPVLINFFTEILSMRRPQSINSLPLLRLSKNLAVMVAFPFALCALPHAQALEKGSAAPAFELNGVDGQVNLSKYQGKFVYLDFWASWCGPCHQSFPWLNALQAKYGTQGLQVIGVNVDKKNEDARSFLARTPAHFVVAFDPAGTTPKNYAIKGMPSSVLIGPDGKILCEHTGFKEADSAVLESKIKSALGVTK